MVLVDGVPYNIIYNHLLWDRIKPHLLLFYSGTNDTDKAWSKINISNLPYDNKHSIAIMNNLEYLKKLRFKYYMSPFYNIKNEILRNSSMLQLAAFYKNKFEEENQRKKFNLKPYNQNFGNEESRLQQKHLDSIKVNVNNYNRNMEALLTLAKKNDTMVIVGLQGALYFKKYLHETENASAHIYLNRKEICGLNICVSLLKKCMKNSRLLKASMIMLLW